MPSLPSRLPGKFEDEAKLHSSKAKRCRAFGREVQTDVPYQRVTGPGVRTGTGKAVGRRCVSYAPACDESGR